MELHPIFVLRAGLRSALCAVAGLLTQPGDSVALQPPSAAAEGARIAVLTEGAGRERSRADAREGARLGGSEAARAAELLRRPFTLVEWRGDSPRDAAEVAAWLRAQRATVLVGGFDEAECDVLAAAAAAAGAVFLNIGCTSDALRGARCAPHIFHVAASARMEADARAAQPDDSGATDVVLWHPALARFGAAQVNERYRDATGRVMTAAAWAGWAAVKIAADAALRARGSDGAALAAQLRAPRAQFDGHKGRPLSFRAWDQQLRQPLYLVGSATPASPEGTLLAEVPDARTGGAADPRGALDRIGTPAERSACALGREGVGS